MKYIINQMSAEGGSVEFYAIKNHRYLGFKQFRNKHSATYAYDKQKLLSKLGLAPKVYGKVCKLIIKNRYYTGISGWGYITERAKTVKEKTISKQLAALQKLVEDIHTKTKLKFWDCHPYNLGYITRNNKTKLVCIDTGSESFNSDNDAWGRGKPGPKCDTCQQFNCSCFGY